jgi:hypothetical protein
MMADESLARIYAQQIQQLAVQAELKQPIEDELAQVIGELRGRGDDALRSRVGGMLRVEALASERREPLIPDKPTAAEPGGPNFSAGPRTKSHRKPSSRAESPP